MPRIASGRGRQEAASSSIPAIRKARAGLPPCLKRRMSWRRAPRYWPCSASPCQGGGDARHSPHSSGCPAAGQGRGSPQARQRPPTYGTRARAQAGQSPWARIPASGPETAAPPSSTGVPQTGQRCSVNPSSRARRSRGEGCRSGASGITPGSFSLTSSCPAGITGGPPPDGRPSPGPSVQGRHTGRDGKAGPQDRTGPGEYGYPPVGRRSWQKSISGPAGCR